MTKSLTDNPWKKLSTRQIYKTPWITVEEDQVITPNGSDGIYGVVHTRIAIGIVALTDANEVYMVGQYRYPVDEYSWEIPEGGSEHDEDPLETAKRELREEAGVVATGWEQLGGELHLSNCFSSERGFLYLARGLSEVEAEPDPTEILQIKRVPFVDCLKMLDDGTVKDGLTIMGILRAARMLKLG